MLSGVHGLLLQKNFKFGIFSVVQFVSFLVSSSTAVLLALRGYELSALVVQYVVLQVLIAALTVVFSPFTVRPSHFFHREHAITFWRNGKELFVSQMVEKLVTTLDKIVISRYLGAISLAFYNRAIGSSQRFQSILLGVLQPLFSVSFAGLQEDREKTRHFFHTAVWLVLRASLFITLIIVSAPREFILILFGSNWLFAARLIPLVSIFVLLSPVRTLCRNFLLSNGRFRPVRNIQLLELGMFVIALAVGVYSGGIEGLALSVSVWMLLGVSLYFLNIGRMIAMDGKRLFVLPGVLFVLVTSLSAALRDNPWILGLDIYSAGLVRTAPVVAIVGVALFAFESADLRALVRRVRG
jgi:O-antigen/teichoic acid export membrane protein